MKTTSLAQLGGLAVLLGALLSAIGNLMYFLSGQQPATTLQVWIGIWASAFLVLGLGALYARLAQPGGVQALIGYILLIWGNMASVGSEAVSLGVAQGAFSSDQLAQVPSYVFVGTITAWIVVLGNILLGAAVYRANVFPKYAGALLVLVGVVQAFTGPVVIARPVYALLSFAAWAWLGGALLMAGRTAAPESAAAASN